MKKKYTKAIFGLISVLLAVGLVTFGIWYSYEKSQKSNKELRQQTDAQTTQQAKVVTLKIGSSDSEKSYQVNIDNEITVFDLLKKLQDSDENFTFEYKEYDFGAMITSINGITPDENHFFKLVVNNKDASKGVSDMKVKPGDEVKFVLDEIKF